MKFEPICNIPFNDARECLFKVEGNLRLCETELMLFQDCVHDPTKYLKFQQLATRIQQKPKNFFETRYFNTYLA